MTKTEIDIADIWIDWQQDWNLAARELLGVKLDKEQKAILNAIQHNKMVTVASGAARGKDFVAAVSAFLFLYLTPSFNTDGELIENTKVALTAPTGRQVDNIMFPEIVRLFKRAKAVLPHIPGRLVANDIRTTHEEWFLTGFKADEHNHEAWTGFHAVNTMFVVTEASRITEGTFAAIEGNLQGNSKILIVFNPNTPVGYAARSQRSPRWKRFRLDDLTAPNVIEKKQIIPGQVDYEWVKDKVETWCVQIDKSEMIESEGDFEFEGRYYRPNDWFRIKVQGLFPKVSEDILIPPGWIEVANENWKKAEKSYFENLPARIGVDVAGMGRDASCFCSRHKNFVSKFEMHQSDGRADHMFVAGKVKNMLKKRGNSAYIDTIGEGAGVYSRLEEQGVRSVHSCKFSEEAHGLHDVTGQHEFVNMRTYLFWAVRDWLNPANRNEPCLPPDDSFLEEATEIKWKMQSNGKLFIEPKDDIKQRLGRSTDKFDALANTFYPDERSKGKTTSQIAAMI